MHTIRNIWELETQKPISEPPSGSPTKRIKILQVPESSEYPDTIFIGPTLTDNEVKTAYRSLHDIKKLPDGAKVVNSFDFWFSPEYWINTPMAKVTPVSGYYDPDNAYPMGKLPKVVEPIVF